MNKKIICLLTVFAALSVPLWAAARDYKAVDGDSLVQGERRIRLDGIDAPELTQLCFDDNNQEYACGLSALHYLENLLANAQVNCDCADNRDKYGREICECFADDVSLNQAMVFGGHAVTYRSEKYIDSEQTAKEHQRGIWQGKFMRPALFRALERLQNKNAAEETPRQ